MSNIEIPERLRKDRLASFFYQSIKSRRDIRYENAFCRACLKVSEYIRKNGMPHSPDELSPVVNCSLRQVDEPRYEIDFVKELFEGIKREKGSNRAR